jgi:hypothetical protein
MPAPQAAVAVSAPAPARSKAPAVITLICMFLAGVIAAALLFFLGNNATAYERAERNAMNALMSNFSSIMPDSANLSETGTIIITPSRELSAFGIPDIGSLKIDYEATVDGSDVYAFLGADAFGIRASLQFWQLGEQIIMHLPGISQYYITLSDMGDAMVSGFDYSNYDKLLDEIGVIGNKILDRYFELTKDAEVKWSEEVFVGELSRVCDVYEIIMDEAFLYEIVKAAFEGFLDSDEFLKLVRDEYDRQNQYWVGYSWYQTFDEVLAEMRDELYNADPADFSDGEIITMRVFISGADVIKRDIIIDDTTISYASITERSGEYSRSARFSYTDWWGDTSTLIYIDDGVINGGKSTGSAQVSYRDRWDSFAINISYSDFSLDGGMFNGSVNVSVPVENGLTIDVSLRGTASGNSQNITGSLSVFGMRALDIEINSTGNTGRGITRPPMTHINTLDVNDWWGMELFGEEVMNWASGLNLGLLEDLFYMSGLDSLFYGSYYNDWDDYCYNCWSYDCWGDCDWNWCYWPDDCWCDDCWDYGNYCYDCWSFDCYGFCEPAEVCGRCGYTHWDNSEDYITYILNSGKAIWRIVLGNFWDEGTWNSIAAEFGDCVVFAWAGDWVDAFNASGIPANLEAYYDVTDVIYSVDWALFMDEEFLLYGDYFYWSASEWENFYRSIIRAEGFAF